MAISKIKGVSSLFCAVAMVGLGLSTEYDVKDSMLFMGLTKGAQPEGVRYGKCYDYGIRGYSYAKTIGSLITSSLDPDSTREITPFNYTYIEKVPCSEGRYPNHRHNNP